VLARLASVENRFWQTYLSPCPSWPLIPAPDVRSLPSSVTAAVHATPQLVKITIANEGILSTVQRIFSFIGSRPRRPGRSWRSSSPRGIMAAPENSSESMAILLSMLGQQPQLLQRHERVYQDVMVTELRDNVGDQDTILAERQVRQEVYRSRYGRHASLKSLCLFHARTTRTSFDFPINIIGCTRPFPSLTAAAPPAA
jgi:hypothetical protein